MTNNSGLSGDGGVMSQGNRACRPNKPITFRIGTVAALLSASPFFFMFISSGDRIEDGGTSAGGGMEDGIADKNDLDCDEDDDEIEGEAITAAVRKMEKKIGKLLIIIHIYLNIIYGVCDRHKTKFAKFQLFHNTPNGPFRFNTSYISLKTGTSIAN